MEVQQVEDIEAYSALKQSIIRHLYLESDRLGCPATDQWVINYIVNYFVWVGTDRKPMSHQSYQLFVPGGGIVTPIKVSTWWFSALVAPHSDQQRNQTGVGKKMCSLLCWFLSTQQMKLKKCSLVLQSSTQSTDLSVFPLSTNTPKRFFAGTQNLVWVGSLCSSTAFFDFSYATKKRKLGQLNAKLFIERIQVQSTKNNDSLSTESMSFQADCEYSQDLNFLSQYLPTVALRQKGTTDKTQLQFRQAIWPTTGTQRKFVMYQFFVQNT